MSPEEKRDEMRSAVARTINKRLAATVCERCGKREEVLPFCREPRCPTVGAYELYLEVALRLTGLTRDEYYDRTPTSIVQH